MPCVWLAALGVSATSLPAQERQIALVGATIIPIDGPVIDGGTLVVHDAEFFMNTTGGLGGALRNQDTTDAGIVSKNLFNNNSCDDGPTCGGAIAGATGLVLDDNDFVHNTPNDTTP